MAEHTGTTSSDATGEDAQSPSAAPAKSPGRGKDSVRQILVVTILLCLVCSVLVAFTAVALKQRQQANKRLDIEKNILEVTGLAPDADRLSREEIVKISKANITPALVDLKTGHFYRGDALSAETYDVRAALNNPALSAMLPSDEDPALIKREEKYARVFMVKDKSGHIKTLVLPVRGYGLWSTLWGFLALKGDFITVQGLTFYDQKETPGLGGEVDNPRWKAQWHDKQVFAPDGRVDIQVVKSGAADPARAAHQVDAISGATLTSRGVNNLINFWLGPRGFGPFLQYLKSGGGSSKAAGHNG